MKIIYSILFLLVLVSCKDDKSEVADKDLYSKVITELEYYGSYTKDSTLQKSSLLNKYISKYDLNGKISVEQSFNDKNELKSKTIYSHTNDGYEAFEYNSKGQLTNRYVGINNNEGSTAELKVYSYDDKLLSQIFYTYDSNNYLIEQTVNYFADGDTLNYFIEYINDEKGNILEVLNYGSDDTLLSRTANEYMYFNASGDWITRKTVLDNGSIRITEREIQQYQ